MNSLPQLQTKLWNKSSLDRSCNIVNNLKMSSGNDILTWQEQHILDRNPWNFLTSNLHAAWGSDIAKQLIKDMTNNQRDLQHDACQVISNLLNADGQTVLPILENNGLSDETFRLLHEDDVNTVEYGMDILARMSYLSNDFNTKMIMEDKYDLILDAMEGYFPNLDLLTDVCTIFGNLMADCIHCEKTWQVICECNKAFSRWQLQYIQIFNAHMSNTCEEDDDDIADEQKQTHEEREPNQADCVCQAFVEISWMYHHLVKYNTPRNEQEKQEVGTSISILLYCGVLPNIKIWELIGNALKNKVKLLNSNVVPQLYASLLRPIKNKWPLILQQSTLEVIMNMSNDWSHDYPINNTTMSLLLQNNPCTIVSIPNSRKTTIGYLFRTLKIIENYFVNTQKLTATMIDWVIELTEVQLLLVKQAAAQVLCVFVKKSNTKQRQKLFKYGIIPAISEGYCTQNRKLRRRIDKAMKTLLFK